MLRDSGYIEPQQSETILNECDELCKIIETILQ
ncbi:MAG: hypothetical protein JW915_24625 [Chitinispirillaceae bacterium]|nr:hypothetical protein [Chitinispirillaceae bacterium]